MARTIRYAVSKFLGRSGRNSLVAPFGRELTEKSTEFYEPSQSNFVINYRIDEMDEMVAQLKQNKVTIVKGPESHENGKFLELLDLEGNKVQLWEPKIWDEKNKEL